VIRDQKLGSGFSIMTENSPIQEERISIITSHFFGFGTVYLFIMYIDRMTKIEIEGKCYDGDSNHELKVNAVILIEIIKHVKSLFLRDIHNMNK
jgi:hypothetical protein